MPTHVKIVLWPAVLIKHVGLNVEPKKHEIMKKCSGRKEFLMYPPFCYDLREGDDFDGVRVKNGAWYFWALKRNKELIRFIISIKKNLIYTSRSESPHRRSTFTHLLPADVSNL